MYTKNLYKINRQNLTRLLRELKINKTILAKKVGVERRWIYTISSKKIESNGCSIKTKDNIMKVLKRYKKNVVEEDIFFLANVNN